MGEYEAGFFPDKAARPPIRLWAIVCVALALLLLPACAADDPGPGKHAMVIGHVDLPTARTAAGADLQLRLKDPALAGRVLGQSTIKRVSGGRIPFVIRYDPRQIVADQAYEIEVEVVGMGESRLAMTLPIEVNPHDQPEIELALGGMREGAVESGGSGNADGEPAPSEVTVLPAQAPSTSSQRNLQPDRPGWPPESSVRLETRTGS